MVRWVTNCPCITFVSVCVARYRSNHKIKSFTCYNQYLRMAFGQLRFMQNINKEYLG